MSVTVMSIAWYVGNLSPAQKAVLVALADHANDEGCHVYPSVERLTYKTSYAERTVRRALSDLREMGLITVVAEATHHRPTEYKLELPEMQARQERPDTSAPHDLPEMQGNGGRPARDAPHDLPESAKRPARDAPKPSVNHQEQPSEESDAPARAKNPYWSIPENLGSDRFVRAWSQWLDYVAERALDFTETQAHLSLEELSEAGEEVATASVIRSIRRGWRNIYLGEPNGDRPRASPGDDSDPLDWKPQDELGATY